MSYDEYADEIRYILLSEHVHRAVKRHECSYCSRGIPAGTIYRKRFGLSDVDRFGRGEPFTEKTCQSCLESEHMPY